MLRDEKIESNFRDITALGSYMIQIPLLVILYLLDQKTLSFQLFTGFVLSYLIAFVIRVFYFKDRPEREKHDSFLSKIDSSSFPSVHSARAFIFAIIISYNFANAALTFFLLIVAMIVSYSRIYLKKHDWIDVSCGIFMGVLISLLIIKFF